MKGNVVLYLYVMGSKNGTDYIAPAAVPFKISNEELFFGPCERYIREDLRSQFLGNNGSICPKDLGRNIFIAGINPLKDENIRKVLFMGEIIEICTFKAAWMYYNAQLENLDLEPELKEGIRKMINGENGQSPLHLVPIIENGLDGYQHRTNEHKTTWITDILSDKEIQLYGSKETISDKIFKENGIEFKRDCCFRLKNIFFADGETNPVSLNDQLLDIVIRSKPKTSKLKDENLYSPFGFNSEGNSFGRLKRGRKICDKDALQFISIIEKQVAVDRGEIN